jgi:hypothetical protein
MSKTFLPLAKSPISTPDLWSKTARNWLATGVIKAYLNEIQVYADSTGMQIKVKSGAANVQGIYFDSDEEEVLAIAAANATNPRIDRVIVRLDLPGDSIDFAVLQGVPAVSPTAPALTQNNTRWEISLAQVYVGANVSTIVAGNITDERIKVPYSLKGNGELVETGFTGTLTIPAGQAFGFTFTFPKAFASPPNVIITPFGGDIATSYYLSAVVNGITTTNFKIDIKNTSASDGYIKYNWIAMGEG